MRLDQEDVVVTEFFQKIANNRMNLAMHLAVLGGIQGLVQLVFRAQRIGIGPDITILQGHRSIVQLVDDPVGIRCVTIVLLPVGAAEFVGIVGRQFRAQISDLFWPIMVFVQEVIVSKVQLGHGVDDHAVFGKGDHLVVNGLKVAFDLGLFNIPHTHELIECLVG